MSSTDWGEPRDPDAERVDPGELDDVPAGSADDLGDVGDADEVWTPGGGTLGAEGEPDEGSLAGAGAEDAVDEPGANADEERRT